MSMEKALDNTLISSDVQTKTGKLVPRKLSPSKSVWQSLGARTVRIPQEPRKVLDIDKACGKPKDKK